MELFGGVVGEDSLVGEAGLIAAAGRHFLLVPTNLSGTNFGCRRHL
jgi:hypothetical protein